MPTSYTRAKERSDEARHLDETAIRVGCKLRMGLHLEHFPFVLNREGFPKSCQCASLMALIRLGEQCRSRIRWTCVNG
jgi:hypothetical protein